MGDTSGSTSESGEPVSTGGLSRIRARLGFGGERSSFRKELLRTLSRNSTASGEFSKQERSMLLNTLRFGSTRIDDVMIPRADITAIEVDRPLNELLHLFEKDGHSRVPVYRGTLDDIVGIVHVKDFLVWMTKTALTQSNHSDKAAGESQDRTGKPKKIDLSRVNLSLKIEQARLTREVEYIPASMIAVDLLLRMQATRNHMALVVDEYGGTDGLVTIEDLLEEIVGEIEDEHDDETEEMIEEHDMLGLVASARVPVEELEENIGRSLVLPSNDEAPQTLGGLVFILSGSIPVRGEIITHPEGVEFEVLEADSRKIKKLKVTVKELAQKDTGDPKIDQTR